MTHEQRKLLRKILLRHYRLTASVSPAVAKMLELLENSPCPPPPKKIVIYRRTPSPGSSSPGSASTPKPRD
jgi:hypothetical protein